MDLIYAVCENGLLKICAEPLNSSNQKIFAVYLTGTIVLEQIKEFINIPLIFASEGSRFDLSDVIGRFEQPSSLSSIVIPLVERLGSSTTLELLLASTPFDAAQAKQHRLINDVLTREQFDERVAQLARLSLSAIELAIDISRRALHLSHWQAEQLERYAFALRFTHPDQREGMQAFLEKRSPKFPNRL